MDHDAGSAAIKEAIGARYMVMDADVPVVESGGKADFFYGDSATSQYRPTKVDRVLHDGDHVRLGGTDLVAHITPGHTKGCTRWTMKVKDGSKTLDVVIIGGTTVNDGFNLIDDFDLASKYPKLKPGAANPFIDRAGYRAFVANRDSAFRAELARQKAERQIGKLR